MKKILKSSCALAAVAVGILVACTSTKVIDISGSVRTSLDQAGFNTVTSSQNRETGVVTLRGMVSSDSERSQAEYIAQSIAEYQLVANQIAVLPQSN